MTALRAAADLGAVLGGTGVVSMAVYRFALRYVDWTLLPASVAARVRWWTGRSGPVLRISLVIATLGVVGLAVGR